MIQINLIPDIKAEFLKAQKTTRMVTAGAVLASVAVLVITIGMYSFANFQQARHLDNLSKDIDSAIIELDSIENIVEAVTVSRQLEALPGLHESKPAADRLQSYLSKIIPSSVNLTEVSLNFERSEITLTGFAEAKTQLDAQTTVNKLVNILKNAEYRTVEVLVNETEESNAEADKVDAGEDLLLDESELNEDEQIISEAVAAFVGVTLESVNSSEGENGEEQKSFEITFNFDPQLFDQAVDINFSIPNTDSDQTGFKKLNTLFTPGAF